MSKKPVIYDYNDYRKFLADSYAFLKKDDANFSFRAFSAASGFKSPNALKLLIDGKRNLTLQSIRKVSKGLRLGQGETTFFKNLVFMNQSDNSREREDFARRLTESQVFRDLHPLRALHFAYYSEWYHVPIRELAASRTFRDDPAWIARRLRNKITPEQAAQALANLLDLGLLKREHGRIRPTHANVTTGHEIASAAVAGFHRQMMTMAGQSIDEVERAMREISSSTLLVSRADFPRLKQMIQEFRQKLLAEALLTESANDAEVYQISFLAFPLSQPLAEGSEKEEQPCAKSA